VTMIVLTASSADGTPPVARCRRRLTRRAPHQTAHSSPPQSPTPPYTAECGGRDGLPAHASPLSSPSQDSGLGCSAAPAKRCEWRSGASLALASPAGVRSLRRCRLRIVPRCSRHPTVLECRAVLAVAPLQWPTPSRSRCGPQGRAMAGPWQVNNHLACRCVVGCRQRLEPSRRGPPLPASCSLPRARRPFACDAGTCHMPHEGAAECRSPSTAPITQAPWRRHI
jgi:hypothetical protein